jgi:hypothetical protein
MTGSGIAVWAARAYTLDPPVIVALAIGSAGGMLALVRSLREAYLAVAKPRLGRIVLDGFLWVEVMNTRGEKPWIELQARCEKHRLPLYERDSDGYLRPLNMGGSQNLWCAYGDQMSDGHPIAFVKPTSSRPYEVAYNRARAYMTKRKDPR